jgi:hypothetical protein
VPARVLAALIPCLQPRLSLESKTGVENTMSTVQQQLLIADDNPIVGETFAQWLRGEGHDVIAAETGTRAFLVLRDFSQAINRLYARAALPGLIDGWILADAYQDRQGRATTGR